MTPQEMLNQVRIEIDEPTAGNSPFWYNAELMEKLHQAQGYIYRKMIRARDNMFLTSEDITLTASQSTYNLPLNARLGVTWALIENRISSANPPLYVHDMRFQDYLMVEGPISVTDPADLDFGVALQRDQVRVSPTPGSSHTDGLRFWFNPMFGAMQQGTAAATPTTTGLVLAATPSCNRGGTAEITTDPRDDYYNAMDVMIVADETESTAVGQVRRISDYDGGNRRITVPEWTVTPSTDAEYAILCPIPEDFHDTVVLRASWLAASKRPRLLRAIEAKYIDAYQEAIGFITDDQSFSGDAVIPVDHGSY